MHVQPSNVQPSHAAMPERHWCGEMERSVAARNSGRGGGGYLFQRQLPRMMMNWRLKR